MAFGQQERKKSVTIYGLLMRERTGIPKAPPPHAGCLFSAQRRQGSGGFPRGWRTGHPEELTEQGHSAASQAFQGRYSWDCRLCMQP